MFTEDSVSARRLKTGLKPVFLSTEKDATFAEAAIESFNKSLGKKLSDVVLLATSSVAKKKPTRGLVHALFILQEFETAPDKKKISSLDAAKVATKMRTEKSFERSDELRSAVASHFGLSPERLDAILAEENELRVYKKTSTDPNTLIALYNFEYWNLLHKLAQSPFAANWHERKLIDAEDYAQCKHLNWAGKKVAFSFYEWREEMHAACAAVSSNFQKYLTTK
jgi:predicted nuclease of restriction endonuclease-like RecB superfamily